jgi:cysteine-rich repeat protein
MDTCTEICGDGFNWGTYACDDGNLVNGDGCDDTCTVEANWVCGGGNDALPDICEPISLCDLTTIDYGVFPCVDHNVANGDGCND